MCTLMGRRRTPHTTAETCASTRPHRAAGAWVHARRGTTAARGWVLRTSSTSGSAARALGTPLHGASPTSGRTRPLPIVTTPQVDEPQCSARRRSVVMSWAQSSSTLRRGHDVCARGLVPISLQDVQPRKHFVPPPRLSGRVSASCVGARAHGATVVVLQQRGGRITAPFFGRL